MNIRLSCDNCGKLVSAPKSAIGRTGKCPGCGVSFVVEDPSEGVPDFKEVGDAIEQPPALQAVETSKVEDLIQGVPNANAKIDTLTKKELARLIDDCIHRSTINVKLRRPIETGIGLGCGFMLLNFLVSIFWFYLLGGDEIMLRLINQAGNQ